MPIVSCGAATDGVQKSSAGTKTIDTLVSVDDGLLISLVLLATIIAVPIVFYFVGKWERVIVSDWEAGLLFRNGKYMRTLPGGRHWVYPPTSNVVKIDLRPVTFSLDNLAVVANDGVYLSVSGIATLQIDDPFKAFNLSENFYNHAFFQLQASVRNILSSAPSHRLSQWGREALSHQILRDANAKVVASGVAFSSFEISELSTPNRAIEAAVPRAN
jgi:uncharacterized membrane protein YqiK